jgi:hypothetical protein
MKILLEKYRLVYRIVFEREHIQKQCHSKLALNYEQGKSISRREIITLFTQQDPLREQDVHNLNHSLRHKHPDFLFQVYFSLEKRNNFLFTNYIFDRLPGTLQSSNKSSHVFDPRIPILSSF